MKIYTYNNSDNNYNNLKNYLNNNAKKSFPWLFSGDYNDTRDFIDTYYGPYTKKNFNNIKFNNCPCYNCPFNSCKKSSYDIDDLDDAIYKLQCFNSKNNITDYDYKLFGMPVKVYQNFIQIGYNIIPRDEFGHIMIDCIPKEEYKTIINIITTINIYMD